MVGKDATCLDAMSTWLGIDLTEPQRRQLTAYAEWLGDEGLALGGVGPAERTRVWERHICDALCFGTGLTNERSLLDVGSGVGLPGIPLAIAFPDLVVTLVDRAGRRIDALERIEAILRLGLRIVHADVREVRLRTDRLVLRASLPLARAAKEVPRLLNPQGEAWFGLGRGTEPDALRRYRTAPPPVPMAMRVEEVFVPAQVLDSGVWLLRMTVP